MTCRVVKRAEPPERDEKPTGRHRVDLRTANAGPDRDPLARWLACGLVSPGTGEPRTDLLLGAGASVEASDAMTPNERRDAFRRLVVGDVAVLPDDLRDGIPATVETLAVQRAGVRRR